ncbi:MAG: DNA internalization-related competence protein ComEC/Rec2, partial [Lachnospiraceae bacterium]|nr:DNA internalization-related competence protein ComEC/Rec2 [Lachnospiraceae bacterium]
MVKRPLVLLTLFYLFGILAGRGCPQIGILFPVLLILSFILLMIKNFFLLSKSKIPKRIPILLKYLVNIDCIILLLPVALTMGFLLVQRAMSLTALEQYVQETREGGLRGRVISCTQGKNTGRMVLRIDFMEGAPKKVEGEEILVYLPPGKLFAPGSIVVAEGKWNALSRGDNPGQFDEYNYYKAQGICAKGTAEYVRLLQEKKGLSAVLFWLKQKMKQVYGRVLPETEAGVLEAMFLAEKGGLTAEIREMYRDSGFSHILAVSGMHLSLLGMGFYKILKKLRAGSNMATAAACGMVLLYSIFTGAGIPVLRAATMLLLALLAAPSGKTYDAPTGLSVAAFAVLIREPLQLFQPGFLLSFGAVVGILMFSEIFMRMGLKKLAANIGVQLVLLPLLFWFYYEVPIYALFLNLLAVPFLSLLLLLAVLIGVMGIIWLPAGSFFAGGAYVLLKGYEALCRVNAALPGNSFCYGRPSLLQLLLYYALLLCFYFLCRKVGGRKCLFFLITFFVFLLRGKKQLTVTYLSVGQWDCAVIESGGTTVLIDAGSSQKGGAQDILVPYLKYHGTTWIDYVLLSHTDDDHCSMLVELLDDMAARKTRVFVGTIVLTGAAAKEEEKYTMLLEKAKAAGVDCMEFSLGDMLVLGEEELLCLSPAAGEDFGDANQNSMVLALSTKDMLCLFTGDIAAKQEKRVAGELCRLGFLVPDRIKILKVAHHGSRYSSCDEILSCFSGQTAIISCGKKNPSLLYTTDPADEE